jgi:hypothetical protein
VAEIRPVTIKLEGQQVKVHRNLKNGLWTVLLKDRLVGHLESVNLLNVTFKVRPGGRQRVLDERQKNVHAFAVGTFTAIDSQPATAISYNPYLVDYFFQESDRTPVYAATHLRLHAGKAFATLGGELGF